MNVDLSRFDNSWYSPGRGFVIRALWFVVNALVLRNHLNPSSSLKVVALRMFGARIGSGVVVKPGVNVKYPWNLEIADHSWVGEDAWLDSLAPIRLGRSVCISQGAYLCTGNHDWTSPGFDLVARPIAIEDASWIAARAVVGPGVTVHEGAVLGAASLASGDLEAWTVYAGVPAVAVRRRVIRPA
jgi:putative colanic acid biosynthesis acetyltransferase WcaF